MPLTMAREGEVTSIKRVGGKEEVRRHLENMGFVPGTDVTVVTVNNGNVIVNVKEARVAISREMANKITVSYTHLGPGIQGFPYRPAQF